MPYPRDPYWTTARFASRCRRTSGATPGSACGAPIRKGDRIFYYPASRIVLCETGGADAAADFPAHAFDEAVYASQGSRG